MKTPSFLSDKLCNCLGLSEMLSYDIHYHLCRSFYSEETAVDQTTLDALAAVNGKSDTEKLTEIQKYVKLDSEKFGTVSNGNPLTVPTG